MGWVSYKEQNKRGGSRNADATTSWRCAGASRLLVGGRIRVAQRRGKEAQIKPGSEALTGF